MCLVAGLASPSHAQQLRAATPATAVAASGHEAGPPQGLRCLQQAYPQAVCSIEAEALVLCSGERLPYAEGSPRTPDARLQDPDLSETFAQKYPAFSAIKPPAPDFEPGRARHYGLLRALYGETAREVSAELVSITWMPKTLGQAVKVTRRQGAAAHLQAVSDALDKLPLSLRKPVAEVAGSISFRNIAGTDRASAHAFGIAIDVAPKLADYWRWREPKTTSPRRYRNRLPAEVVEAFEREGFVWGGRWSHYDTMHFEFRPELLQPGCVAGQGVPPQAAAEVPQSPVASSRAAVVTADRVQRYAWLQGAAGGVQDTLQMRIVPPAGFSRAQLAADSFGAWLRDLPVVAGRAEVKLFDGRAKASQNLHAAVVDIDIGKRDLQQCADAVMRLRAEYLWASGRAQEVCFRAASGAAMPYAAYRNGLRPPPGQAAPWTPQAAADKSWQGFRSYLDRVFNLANTASLTRELQAVHNPREVEPGDVYIEPARGGRYGHAVLVLDVAQGEQGERVFLIAQSYMPAQSIHVLHNPVEPGLGAWYRTTPDGSLVTPEWSFPKGSLRRFGSACR